MSVLIRQFKNDSAVKQAVAKAKEQIESGDVPTSKIPASKAAQLQPKRSLAKPAPKV